MAIPDHSTIAEFRRRHETAIAELFNSVLMLCQEAGLVDVGVISIDGTKIRANASRGANRTYEKLVADILKEAEETDQWEDGLFGADRDHELPEHLRTEEGRRQAFAAARRRLEEQTGRHKPPDSRVVELNPESVPKGQGRRGWQRHAQKQLMAQREAAARPIARSRPERLLESVERLEENHQVDIAANVAYERWWATRGQSGLVGNRVGMAPKAFVPAAEPEGQINKSDHDSRMMLTVGQPTGESYNAQAAVTADQIIVAAEISVQSPDFGHLKPTLHAALRELESAGVPERPGVVLADAGYWHQQQIEAIVSGGIQVLVPPDGGLRTDIRPGWDKGMYRFMRTVLAGEHGGSLYKLRKSTIEPVFGQIKFNRRITRFQRRGRSAALSEWRLITATHNLMKLHNHQITALG